MTPTHCKRCGAELKPAYAEHLWADCISHLQARIDKLEFSVAVLQQQSASRGRG